MTNDHETGKGGRHPVAAKRERRWLRRLVFLGLLAIGLMYGMSMMATPPDDLGVRNGRLAPCPDSPNCVSTMTDSVEHRMEPVSIPQGIEPLEIVSRIMADQPRMKQVSEQPRYLRYEATSLIFRFVDDVEFLVADGQLHFRSASRVGHSDLGANRRRMERIREQLVRAFEAEAAKGG